jgi:Skp family chaperone for outer membrane proteins
MKGLCMMFSNRFFAIALLVSFSGLFADVAETAKVTQSLQPSIKSDICVVDMEKLLSDLQKEMQALQEKESANFQKEMEAANKKREALTVKKADMNKEEFDNQTLKIDSEIQAKAQAAQVRMQKAQEDAQKRAEEIVKELQEWARKNRVKVLLPSQGVLYFDLACDVTGEALEYIEKNTKKSAAKAPATTNKK